jgi:hypothetical protein
MNARDSRRLGSVKRGRAFGTDHPEIFEGANDAPVMFDDLDRIERELESHFDACDSAVRAERDASKLRRNGRKALWRGLTTVNGFARTSGQAEKFQLPSGCGDERMLSLSRSFAVDAVPFADMFGKRGMKATTVTDLPAQAHALDKAMAAQAKAKADHVSARTAIEIGFEAAAKILDAMGMIVARGAREDPKALVEWKNIRRIGPTRAKQPVATPPATAGSTVENPSKTPAA